MFEETRPRVTRFASGTFIILRGVNLPPASVPTDMISIRLWVEKHRIISRRIRRLLSVRAIRERCERNDAPVSVGDFLVDINVGLIECIAGVVQTLEDEIDELEAITITKPFSLVRARLADERQKLFR